MLMERMDFLIHLGSYIDECPGLNRHKAFIQMMKLSCHVQTNFDGDGVIKFISPPYDAGQLEEPLTTTNAMQLSSFRHYLRQRCYRMPILPQKDTVWPTRDKMHTRMNDVQVSQPTMSNNQGSEYLDPSDWSYETDS